MTSTKKRYSAKPNALRIVEPQHLRNVTGGTKHWQRPPGTDPDDGSDQPTDL